MHATRQFSNALRVIIVVFMSCRYLVCQWDFGVVNCLVLIEPLECWCTHLYMVIKLL